MDRRTFLVGTTAAATLTACPTFPASCHAAALLGTVSSNRIERYRRYAEKAHKLPVNHFLPPVISVCNKMHQQVLNDASEEVRRGIPLFAIVDSCAVFGDAFVEVRSKVGVQAWGARMFRIETIHGRLLEFQQGSQPDYDCLSGKPTSVIRYSPEEVVHFRVGNFLRKGFYPYGVSPLENDQFILDKDFEDCIEVGLREIIRRIS